MMAPKHLAMINVYRLLAAIVLGGAVMSEAVGATSADDLRTYCEGAVKCVDKSSSCSDHDWLDAARCGSYISGFIEGHHMALDDSTNNIDMNPYELRRMYVNLCIPESVTNIQLARVFIKYINDHPEQLHAPAYTKLYISWLLAFPCE